MKKCPNPKNNPNCKEIIGKYSKTGFCKSCIPYKSCMKYIVRICLNPTNNPKCKKIVGKYSKKGLCRSCANIKKCSDETKKKISNALIGKPSLLKDKTLEEIHGKEEAEEIIQKMSKPNKSRTNSLKNKTYEEIHGIKEAERLRKLRQKTLEEKCGHEEAKEIRQKQSNSNKGKIPWNKGLTREIDPRVGASPETMEKMRIGNIGKHHSLVTIEKMSLSAYERLENQNGQLAPGYNSKGCQFFNKLMEIFDLEEKIKIFIQHAENGGEFQILRYFVDGYIKEYNIILEYDELRKFNSNGILKEPHIRRQNEIENLYKTKIIRIKEGDSIELIKKIILERIEKKII